ncbi:MAG: ATP-binding protein [Microcystis aeruginosa LG13-11]|jgi:AAA+ superfamily predicted ATPase|nr:ATP-binding protein [Microcystis aeruginosa LG13-11]
MVIEASKAWSENLLPALQWLDKLLEKAVVAAQATYAKDPTTEAYQGLYLTQEDVEQLLVRQPGDPVLKLGGEAWEPSFSELAVKASRLAWLKQTFDLSDFDLALIVIALAPELDLRYERLYAYLQDDVTRRRPTVDLALNLLCSSAPTKLWQRSRVAPDAPLIRHRLLHLLADPHQVQPPLLACYLKPDEQLIRYLLGQEGLDSRLATFCELVGPRGERSSPLLDAKIQQALIALALQAREANQPLHLYFHGPQGVGKRQAAEAIALKLDMRLLVADIATAIAAKTELESILPLLLREAQFQDGVLYLQGIDALGSQEQVNNYQRLWEAIAQFPSIAIIGGVAPSLSEIPGSTRTILPVSFPLPDFAQRRDNWQAYLSQSGISRPAQELDTLADRFRLTPEQIGDAVASAQHQARWQAAQASQEPPHSLSLEDLLAAARAHSGQALTSLARKISPRSTWNDLILPSEGLTQLQEICHQVKHHHLVCGQWGFEEKLSLGKGLNALFSGSPGTGKTMAAEVIAKELHLDLYKIDLSQVVSKYIGETEKNLERIFTAAQSANAILLFDEADALFGKRSEVKDAHDRYANLEIAYLLQKMEEYEGVTLLTTNLRQNLDEAFTRRIRFIVEFPFPEADYRLQIWRRIWPKQTPLAADVDLEGMARQFKLAGGNIRNIALAAAFLAAENSQCVTMKHLLQATKREFQKMGRLIGEEEFLPFKQK